MAAHAKTTSIRARKVGFTWHTILTLESSSSSSDSEDEHEVKGQGTVTPKASVEPAAGDVKRKPGRPPKHSKESKGSFATTNVTLL